MDMSAFGTRAFFRDQGLSTQLLAKLIWILLCDRLCLYCWRFGSYGSEIDTVAISVVIRQIVAEVGPSDGHCFPARSENPHVVPHHFFVPKGWPSVRSRLGHPLLPTSSDL